MPTNEEIALEIKDIKNDLKRTEEKLNQRALDIHTLKETFAKKCEFEKYYTKSEIDRILKSIEELTSSIKQLLEVQMSYIEKGLAELKSDQEEIKVEIGKGKSGAFDKSFGIIVSLIIFLMGFGANLLILFLK